MDSTFRTFLIIAVVLLLAYTGFEIYNSIAGSDSEFNDTIVEIRPNLGDDVLDHINNTSSLMLYYPNPTPQATEGEQVDQNL